MAISLKPENLKRYASIVSLLWKYGRSDLVREAGLEEALSDVEKEPSPETAKLAEELVDDLEKLGPTYVKIGQLLSTRADVLPAPLIDALARLQDAVEPFPFQQVEETVESELGARLTKAFGFFDPKPIAAASLGQVHHAVLRDGRNVAVKVQRPGIRERILGDLETLAEIAELLDAHTETGRKVGFRSMLAEFRKSLLRELDYRQEARNLTILKKNLAEMDRIVVPSPIDDYSSERVLTMELIRGQKITSLHPVVMTDLDGEALADQLFRAYLKQILDDGFFHADPHPGNVLLTQDNQIALLDLGMVAYTTPWMQDQLLRILIALSEGRGEEAAESGIRIGEPLPSFDRSEFQKRISELVARSREATLDQIQVGRTLMAFSRISVECGIRVPSELTMVGKTLLNLDGIGRALDPHFDPNAAVRRNAADLMRRHMLKSLSPGHVFETLIEAKEFVEKLPRRVNNFLDLIANNKLKVQVDAIDETLLMEGFQKVANRITLGLILSSLIIGAAMLMRVETTFRILGYPGLAMLCFLAASAGGIVLVISILRRDRTAVREPPKRSERLQE